MKGEKVKGTKAFEENKRLREKINGADGAKGQYKIHEVENKNVKGRMNDYSGEKCHKRDGGK